MVILLQAATLLHHTSESLEGIPSDLCKEDSVGEIFQSHEK